MSTVYFLIPHPTELKVLTTGADGGGWTLPTVEHDGSWSIEVAPSVAVVVSELLGMRLTALHDIEHNGVHVCVMENCSGDVLPIDTSWIEYDMLSKCAPNKGSNAGRILRAIIMLWMRYERSGTLLADRRW